MSAIGKGLARVMLLAFAVLSVLGGDCDSNGPTMTSTTGTLIVSVRVGTEPRSAATVQISGPVGTAEALTDASGIARFENQQPGQYTISTTLADHNCPSATGNVQAGQTTTVIVTCTVLTGVIGQVTVNGVGQSGVTVELRTPLPDFGVERTTRTVPGGTYQFANVVGTFAVTIVPPSGATCEPPFRDVTVPAGGNATANFACVV